MIENHVEATLRAIRRVKEYGLMGKWEKGPWSQLTDDQKYTYMHNKNKNGQLKREERLVTLRTLCATLLYDGFLDPEDNLPLKLSYPEVAEAIGYTTHTGAMFAVKKGREQLKKLREEFSMTPNTR